LNIFSQENLLQAGTPAASGSLLDERTLDQVIARLTHAWRNGQTEAVQHFAGFVEHAWATAQHGAVVLRVDRWQTDVAEQLAAAHQVGQTA
nr:hypothetical protein [Tanacetum cinerariifolium]